MTRLSVSRCNLAFCAGDRGRHALYCSDDAMVNLIGGDNKPLGFQGGIAVFPWWHL